LLVCQNQARFLPAVDIFSDCGVTESVDMLGRGRRALEAKPRTKDRTMAIFLRNEKKIQFLEKFIRKAGRLGIEVDLEVEQGKTIDRSDRAIDVRSLFVAKTSRLIQNLPVN
jgi:hypothetical protein